jgi:iron complex outermembrane receptor protein
MTRWQAGLSVAYHAGMDLYGSRMQVYVDGRSVYSSYYLGDTHFGLQGLILDDIERIEVLRGSNSASYGANAFLGVVNIITRHTADSQGVMVSATHGEGHINDAAARIGWGNADASFRVSAARSKDSGLANYVDNNSQSRVNFRGDLTVSPQDKIQLAAGGSEIDYEWGIGKATNPFRPVGYTNQFINGRWTHELDAHSSLELRLTHDVERLRDSFIAATTVLKVPYTAVVSTSGEARRTELGAQYQTALGENVRAVGGAEFRREVVRSLALFGSPDARTAQQWRVFGNLEWRASPDWLLQAGAMQESHSITGDAFAPRLAVNYQLRPDHTLRAVTTKAYRSPTVFDHYGDWHFNDIASGALIPVQGRSYLAEGTVSNESMVAHEIGYLGRYRDLGLTVDVRVFVEKMDDKIKQTPRVIGSVATFPNYFPFVTRAENLAGPRFKGVEYELIWQAYAGTKLLFNQAHMSTTQGEAENDNLETPKRTATLAWFQSLPGGLEATLISTFSTPIKWAGGGEMLGNSRRVDLRLGLPFQVGATRGEVALVTQSINGSSAIYKAELKQERRTFVTVRLDF